MRFILVTVLVVFTLLAHANPGLDTIQVIARLVSSAEGSKIYLAQYNVIKVVEGTLTNETITVGYYHYNELKNAPDTALLKLVKYTGDTKMNDYYLFPDYDARKGIEKIRISSVDFDYWEGCETGTAECNPLTFIRSSINEKWFLFMPCGGTVTTVNLTAYGQKSPIQTTNVSHSQCPPVFELTYLADGKYFAYMYACGLGGQIEFNVITKL